MATTLERTDVHAIIAAAREATHSMSHLGSIAALAARHDDELYERATEATLAVAKAAFALDDIFRRHNGSPTSLRACDEALERMEEVLRAARASLADLERTFD